MCAIVDDLFPNLWSPGMLRVRVEVKLIKRLARRLLPRLQQHLDWMEAAEPFTVAHILDGFLVRCWACTHAILADFF
jgi:hypothetical protein